MFVRSGGEGTSPPYSRAVWAPAASSRVLFPDSFAPRAVCTRCHSSPSAGHTAGAHAHEGVHACTAGKSWLPQVLWFQLVLQTSPAQAGGPVGVAGVVDTKPAGPSQRQSAGMCFWSINRPTQSPPGGPVPDPGWLAGPRVWALSVLRGSVCPRPCEMPTPPGTPPPAPALCPPQRPRPEPIHLSPQVARHREAQTHRTASEASRCSRNIW